MIQIFLSASFFASDGAQLYLILQLLYYILGVSSGEKLWHGNLKVCWLKKLLLLPSLIIVSLQHLNGMEVQIFVYYLKEAS